MTDSEWLSAIWEAAEEVGDDSLVLATLMAMRDPRLRDDVRALIAASDGTRASLRVLLRRSGLCTAANAASKR
ncbi:hypothetical protein [Parvularcula oceani]|uniref:hypothetical protein n=1 Tax=Parvularcula oceani TaxID=1247963 RepID=UPI0004E230DC|nr:hypothetical protein [Parvularcula oceani]